MKQLLRGTAAYRILKGDAESGRLSHSYMLYFADAVNLRAALKLFASLFFPADKPSLIESEALTDLQIYPERDKKLTAEAAAQIVSDGAIKPVAHDKKLFIISGFDGASPIFQNKLLKILEEPPQGVYFLLGVTSLAPVLPTVRSRVKLLEIPPFTEEEVFAALERSGFNPENRLAASSCGGVLGTAQNLLSGGWYGEVSGAAEEIVNAVTLPKAVTAAVKWGECKYKNELLSELQRRYFCIVKRYAAEPDYGGDVTVGAAIYAVERINKAFADIRFNANFPSLLYSLLVSIAQKNAESAVNQ